MPLMFIISPGLIFVQKAFSVGLFSEWWWWWWEGVGVGLIIRGSIRFKNDLADIWKEFCF